jgi:hypothetical protein
MRPGLRQLTRCGWLLMAFALIVTADTRAQNPVSASTTAYFVVAEQVKLTVSPITLTFPNSDPDTVPLIFASEGAITISAKARNAGTNQVILSVQASDDLRSGLNVINISALTWTAAGSGFVGGTMSTATAQTTASWSASGDYSGTVTFRLANTWSYAIGSYGTTLTYTLATP